MIVQSHRERERADREQLIVTAARELAEGWDAVTITHSGQLPPEAHDRRVALRVARFGGS